MDNSKGVAFLWDESFFWGLMAYDALSSNNLPFELIRAEDIRKGCLRNYKMLFVPGGWASNKLKALQEKGIEEIRDFVRRGGNYFGICGGAGLTTQEGIGLLDIKRKTTKHRVPSFSGRIYLNLRESFLWQEIKSPVFYAWWPSQFIVKDSSINIIARFGEALPDAFSSDLNVGDINSSDWRELEGIYGINLDPAKLKDEPAVVEGYYGKGRVILSLVHFDTPGDENGSRVLKNIWQLYFKEKHEDLKIQIPVDPELLHSPLKLLHSPLKLLHSPRTLEIPGYLKEIESMVDDLINFGIRNFLWFWRTPMLLGWRRGVRGLEYCSLYWMVKTLTRLMVRRGGKSLDADNILSSDFIQLCYIFKKKAKRLLLLERFAMQGKVINYERSDDPIIQNLRQELFGNAKHYGGLFKDLIEEIDRVIYSLLRNPEWSNIGGESNGQWRSNSCGVKFGWRA